MVYRGQVRGGVVVLQPGVCLPEGLYVAVEPLDAERSRAPLETPRLPLRNGVPVFPRHESGVTPDLDRVNRLRDEATWRNR